MLILLFGGEFLTNIIGYNSKDKNVFNSIGNIYSNSFNVDFVKDPDKLIYQYHNLIYNLGKKYAHRFSNETDRKALFSYIQDAFYTLVMEYDPKSGVDFPGYINRKLKDRVYFSYVNKLQPSGKPKEIKVKGRLIRFDKNKLGKLSKYPDLKISRIYIANPYKKLVEDQDYCLIGNTVKLLSKTEMPILVDFSIFKVPNLPKEFLLKQDNITVEQLQDYNAEAGEYGSYDRGGKLVYNHRGALGPDDSLISMMTYLENNYELIKLDYLIIQFLATGNPSEQALISQLTLQSSYTDKEIHKEYLKVRKMIINYFK